MLLPFYRLRNDQTGAVPQVPAGTAGTQGMDGPGSEMGKLHAEEVEATWGIAVPVPIPVHIP